MSKTRPQSERPSIDGLRRRLNRSEDCFPYVGSMSLRYNGGAMKMCVMEDAWKNAARERDEPGEALQVYFPEKELLLVDLS